MPYTLNGVFELLKRLNVVWISTWSVSPNAILTTIASGGWNASLM